MSPSFLVKILCYTCRAFTITLAVGLGGLGVTCSPQLSSLVGWYRFSDYILDKLHRKVSSGPFDYSLLNLNF